MRTFKTVTIAVWVLTFVAQISLAQKRPSHPPTSAEPLSKFVEAHFANWDRNHNKVLELSEVDHVIEDHSVHGRQAALMVCLRRHMTSHADHHSLTHQQLLKLVDERDFTNSVNGTAKHLETIEHELFLPSDPNLATFNQGRLNDCYLLSTIAAQAHRNPKAIREMIHPDVTGGFRVVFGDGQKIQVPPLTHSELLLGAKLDQRHGSWLAVLEKAYGIIRKRDHARKHDPADVSAGTVPTAMLNFGHSSEIISLLTGHHAGTMKLGKAAHSEQIHELLSTMTRKKHLLCTGTNHDKVPHGMGSNHAYAILGYDAHQRQVKVFNPWGNNFTPKGPSGKEHGYLTKNGVFTVPLDQFHVVFSTVVYETDALLKK